MLSNRHQLRPIGSTKSRQDYFELLENTTLRQITEIEKLQLAQAQAEAFAVNGYCVPCDKSVGLLVDMQSGGQRHAQGWTPNWRERLECPLCHMNNRQRLIATLIKQELYSKSTQQIYFMEQVTPIYQWARNNFTTHQIIGSEYLGHEYPSGVIIKGVRHEDIENFSFSNESFDLIVSNDVFEHVPNPVKAFSECARVLKPGGVMLATMPFHSDKDFSMTRASFINGTLTHFQQPVFHGNPISAEGSLVFTDFGWDVLASIKSSGFSDVQIEVYASVDFGHFGSGQIVFRAIK
jgi:hypothetical protein